MMASPMKVMASTTPVANVTPMNAKLRRAIGIPMTRKSNSDQVRRVNGVSMIVRAISSTLELGSDPQVITTRAGDRSVGRRERPAGHGSALKSSSGRSSQIKHREY